MNRRTFLETVGMGSLSLLAGSCVGPSLGLGPSKPNVVFILADDLGWNDLEPMTTLGYPTPNIAKLYRDGLAFTNAHTSSAVCTPTRYGLLTGRYNWRSWLKDWVVGPHMPLLIDQDRMTLQKMMQEQGYATACVGKWHLGWGDKNQSYYNGDLSVGPVETGFDTFFGVPFSHNSPTWMKHFVRDDRIVGLRDGEQISDPETAERLVRDMEQTADRLTEEAVTFIEEHQDRPFFLYFPTTNVHSPATPHPRFKKIVPGDDYGAFVAEFDWMVGQVMEALERTGQTDNTLLIVTSDNGSTMPDSNKPWRGAKCQNYEGGHRVPFVARWPGHTPAGASRDDLICLNDTMATLAERLGVSLPDDAGEDSISYLSALEGNPRPLPRRSLVHHSISGLFAITCGRWKLLDHAGHGGWLGMGKRIYPSEVEFNEDGSVKDFTFNPVLPKPGPGEPPGQLYDLKTDPYEQTNLWDERPDIVKKMKELLNAHREQPNTRTLATRALD